MSLLDGAELLEIIRQRDAAVADLEASRARNRGLVAEVENLKGALAQAQTLIAGALHSAPAAVSMGEPD